MQVVIVIAAIIVSNNNKSIPQEEESDHSTYFTENIRKCAFPLITKLSYLHTSSCFLSDVTLLWDMIQNRRSH